MDVERLKDLKKKKKSKNSNLKKGIWNDTP